MGEKPSGVGVVNGSHVRKARNDTASRAAEVQSCASGPASEPAVSRLIDPIEPVTP